MRGTVAKKLRREAYRRSQGKANKKTMSIRRFLTGKKDEEGNPEVRELAGTIRHTPGTFKRIYKHLKRQYRERAIHV